MVDHACADRQSKQTHTISPENRNFPYGSKPGAGGQGNPPGLLVQRKAPRAERRAKAQIREIHVYFGSRSSSSIEMPCGPRRKQILMPGRGTCGGLLNSTPLPLSSAAMASMPLTASPK